MTVEKIAAAREAHVNKAIAQIFFVVRQGDFTLNEADLRGFIKNHGVTVMSKVMAILKPVDLGDRLSFGTSFLRA